jgi:hypothetical protein
MVYQTGTCNTTGGPTTVDWCEEAIKILKYKKNGKKLRNKHNNKPHTSSYH